MGLRGVSASAAVLVTFGVPVAVSGRAVGHRSRQEVAKVVRSHAVVPPIGVNTRPRRSCSAAMATELKSSLAAQPESLSPGKRRRGQPGAGAAPEVPTCVPVLPALL